MQTITLEVPTLYGDHHVTEVRRILLEMAGVVEVYASSSFRIVEISYQPEQVSQAELTATLEKAGYLGSWVTPMETQPSTFLRHTAVYENVRQVVSFAQAVNATGRPLWPCPGVVGMETRVDTKED